MKPLWAPWRMEYSTGDRGDGEAGPGCVFCVGDSIDQDSQRQILHRGRHAFVVMNRFPYSNGHLLVVPYRHLSDISELNAEERAEMFALVCLSQQVLKEVMNPNGFNLGMNLGTAAGAGIAAHLHWHVVPRWEGDTNFMPVIGELRVIPQHFLRTYELLAEAFAGRVS